MAQKFQPLMLALAAAAALTACGGGGSSDTGFGEAELAANEQPPLTDEPLVAGSSSAPESAMARESAQSLSCPSNDYSKPRVAAWDMSRDTSESRQALLARFELSVVNMPLDVQRTRAFSDGVKRANPGHAIAQYLNFPDVRPAPATTDYAYELAHEADARGWWLKNAAGTRVSWTSGYSYGLNMTTWAPANAAGQRYPQFRAQHDHAKYFANDNGIDYVFTANTWARPRVDADWRRVGTNQSRNDLAVQAAMRAGYAAYWKQLRTLQPSIKVMAGLDNGNDLSATEYKGIVEGAFLDGMIGKSWSLETLSGWDTMMGHYRNVMANTAAEKAVVFSVYGSSPTDYATMRYGLASALMHDGMYMFIPTSGSQVPAWYDEYSAPLGKAVQAPPTVAASNGIWMRKFENGLVLVNPRDTSATIDVGSGYQRLSGTQDRTVNSGVQQSSVTLGARQGLVMIKVPVPCVEPEREAPAPTPTPATYATPKVAALDYSRNTTTARKELLAKYDFVILSFTKTMGGTKLQAMASDLKTRNPDIKLAQYVAINEARCEATSTEDQYAVTSEVHRNDWWLRNSAGQRVQWTTAYGNCDVNIGSYAKRNAKGQTYAQFKWEHDHAAWFRDATKVDYVFIDNFWHETRGIPADWKLNGIDLAPKNAEANLIFRKGMASYVNTVRTVTPRLKVVGNVNHDLSMADYQGLLDGAFIEGIMGKSWSRETWAGWDSMMSLYRGALRNTRDHGRVFFNTFANPTDYKLIRYGLASAMMDDGYFLHIPLSGTMQPNWVDEYGAPIGDPVGAAPTAAAQNGIWRRDYTNGLVLVNPSKTATATINVGSGYKRLSGTQDPAVNNGRAESVVTLGPRQGLLMIKQ